MQIHKGWLEPFDPVSWKNKRAWQSEKAGKHGTEPRICDHCKRGYVPSHGKQMYCTEPNCERARERKRKQERRDLARMLQQADEQKQLSKQHMIDVKAEMRKRKGMRA